MRRLHLADVAEPIGAPKSRSIAWHLGVLVASIAVPSLLYIGYLLWSSAQGERQHLRERIAEKAQVTATAIQRELAAQIATMETFALSSRIPAGDWSGVHRSATAIAQATGNNVLVRGVDGQQIINARVPYGAALPQIRFDIDDEIIATRRPAVTGIFMGPVAQAPLYGVAAPVLAPGTRDVTHIVNFGIPAERVRDRLVESTGSDPLIASVIDRHGRILARSRGHEALVGSEARHLRASAVGAIGVFDSVVLDGPPLLTAFARVPEADWLVLVSVEEAALNAPVTRLVRNLVIVGLVVGLFTSVVALLIAQRITFALQQLAASALAVGRGDSIAPIPSAIREVNRISYAMAASAVQLRERTQHVQASEARLRRLIDNLFAFVGVLDMQGRLVELNKAPLEAGGLRREDVVGEFFWNTLWWSWSPQVQERIRNAVMRALGGETVRFDEEIRAAGGARICIDIQIAPLRDERGTIVGAVPSGVDIHDRVTTQRELAAARARLEASIASAEVGTWTWDVDQDHLVPDRNLAAMFGFDPRETSTCPLAAFAARIHPDDQSRIAEAISRAITQGGGYEEDYRVTPPGRPERWVAARGNTVVDENGRVAALNGVVIDISARKRSEMEREAILASITDGFIVLDREYRFTFVNEAAERLLGMVRGDLLGNSHWDLFPATCGTALEEHYQIAMNERRAVSFEHYYPPWRRWFALSAYPSDTGGISVFFSDTTERKHAEEALERERATLRAVYEAVPVGIAIAEAPDGRIVSGNPQMEAIFRHPVLETNSIDEYDRWISFDADGNRIPGRHYPLAQTLLLGRKASLEVHYQRGDGTRAWIRIDSAPIVDAAGRVTAAVVACLDIDNEKRLLDQQKLLIRELHHRIKNNLALVQAIASSTARSVDGLDAFKRAFSDRLVSLGRTHTLLTDKAWRSVGLRDLLDLEFEPFAAGGNVTMTGPDVQISADSAVSLGMVVHELATNAVKYGALSVPTGRLSLDWTVHPHGDGDRLHLTWTESAGPSVLEPQRRGFGSLLLERMLSGEDGGVEVEYRPDGVRASIALQIEREP